MSATRNRGLLRWLLVIMLACTAGVAAFQARHRHHSPPSATAGDLPQPQPPPAVGPEVLRSGLTLRDGRYFRMSETQPFNGVVIERYPHGAPLYRCGVSNGLLEGLSQGWYSNGQMQVSEPLHAGVSHGTRIKWHENGIKASQATIVAGRLDGLYRRWDENGALAEEINLRNGNPDGVARSFYPSGRVKVQAQMKDGKLVDQKTWADGEGPLAATRPPVAGP